jgi:hypothetical protein
MLGPIPRKQPVRRGKIGCLSLKSLHFKSSERLSQELAMEKLREMPKNFWK